MLTTHWPAVVIVLLYKTRETARVILAKDGCRTSGVGLLGLGEFGLVLVVYGFAWCCGSVLGYSVL